MVFIFRRDAISLAMLGLILSGADVPVDSLINVVQKAGYKAELKRK